MANNIDELPDDILSHILSLLTIRDTVRARLSSPRWLNIPDSRAVINVTFMSVLGDENPRLSYSPESSQSEFMKIANRFMQVWSGNKLDALIIAYKVGKEHLGEIDKWIAKAFRMKVERMDICVTHTSEPTYIFPCTALQREYKPNLKQLSLSNCSPSFLDTSWLSNLTALDIDSVPLDRQSMNGILSSATNLVSLEIRWCEMGELSIDGQLLHLKKLSILHADLIEFRLNCPSLEILEYRGRLDSISFVHVPVLKEAKIRQFWHPRTNVFSVLFNDLNIQAPSLEALSITVGNDVRRIPPTLARYNLKELQLKLTHGFDLLSIKYLLNACPCLEVLQIFFSDQSNTKSRETGNRECCDPMQHHELRKVKFINFEECWNTMTLARYLLRNAVALEEMEVVTLPNDTEFLTPPNGIESYQSLRILQEKINPTARFIVS